MSFNPVTKAVFEAGRRIPREILEQVFMPRYNQWRSAPVTINDEIAAVVIRPRVLVDCNIAGGQEVWIRLIDVPHERTEDMMSVIYVPKSKTQGRAISQVLHLGYVDYLAATNQNTLGVFKPCSVTPVGTALSALNAAYDVSGMMGTSRLELIGENVVLVKDPAISPTMGSLRCILENDENLSNLSIRSYAAFAKLCEHAIKSHIYNTLVIKLDSGRIQGGFELGAFKQIVDSYSDQEQMYQEFLAEKWTKIQFMGDRESMERFIRRQVGGFR